MQSADAVTPGSDVRDRGELEQALHGAVLAKRAVEDREDDVDGPSGVGALVRGTGSVSPGPPPASGSAPAVPSESAR